MADCMQIYNNDVFLKKIFGAYYGEKLFIVRNQWNAFNSIVTITTTLLLMVFCFVFYKLYCAEENKILRKMVLDILSCGFSYFKYVENTNILPVAATFHQMSKTEISNEITRQANCNIYPWPKTSNSQLSLRFMSCIHETRKQK